MRQVAPGEELGDILVGGPGDGHAKLVAVFRLEIGLVLLVVEPVVAEPVKVRELLVRQLVELAVRPGGKGQPDEIVEIQRRVGDVGALFGHPVGQVARLLVAPMRADQVGVVDIGVVDVLARLHLGLQPLDHVAFADQVMRDLDAGDLGEGGGQHLAFEFMGGDALGDDPDIHALERLCRIHEPLHLRFLLLPRENGESGDLVVEKSARLLHAGGGRHTEGERDRRRCRE